MAADLATLKARIARELHRADLSVDIANAIQSAIRYYRSRPFEFGEATETLTTTIGTAAYARPAVAAIHSIGCIASGLDYILNPVNFSRYERLAGDPADRGQPQAFSFYGGSLYLWPLPDRAYPLTLRYQKRVDPPSLDTDVTVWTDDAEDLIRARAKKLICRDVTMNANGMQAAQMAEAEALDRLLDEALRNQDVGRLAGSW